MVKKCATLESEIIFWAIRIDTTAMIDYLELHFLAQILLPIFLNINLSCLKKLYFMKISCFHFFYFYKGKLWKNIKYLHGKRLCLLLLFQNTGKDPEILERRGGIDQKVDFNRYEEAIKNKGFLKNKIRNIIKNIIYWN